MPEDLDRQAAYWDRVAAEKDFALPMDAERFLSHVGEAGRILDVGCGYGRLCGELMRAGARDVVGVDIAPKMIERGRSLFPGLDLRVQEGDRLPFADGAFDGVVLVAVLTCIPSDVAQLALMDEVRRVLKPDGVLYMSDYPLQEDERNQRRYQTFADRYGTYGVFELSDGAVVRHMSRAWLAGLMRPFEVLGRWEAETLTMNGHAARVVQYIGRVREGS